MMNRLNPCLHHLRWMRRSLLLAACLGATQASAGVVVRHGSCPPGAPPPRSEICAESATNLPTQVLLSGTGGDLVAGGSSDANSLHAYLSNTFGGNARVTVTQNDVFTLNGAPAAPIAFTAFLAVEGTKSVEGSAGMGFLNTTASYHAAPASLLLSPGSSGAVSEVLVLPLLLLPGSSVSLGFQIDLLGAFGALHDFSSTVTLGFRNLPSGYHISSQKGFSGVGGPPASNAVPAPGSLALLALAVPVFLVLRRKVGRTA